MLDAVARCVLRGTTFCERDVFLGVCFAWQAQRIHTFCGRDGILVTCVENSWQEQHLVRCVYVCVCVAALLRAGSARFAVCCFCVIGGGGVLRMLKDLSPKRHNIMRKKWSTLWPVV